VFNMLTKHVSILEQCTNKRSRDENSTFIVVSLLVHKLGWRGVGAYSNGEHYSRGGANLNIYGVREKNNQ